MHPDESILQCPLCNQLHALRSLRRGQRAHCVRCDTALAERGWGGSGAALAFALAGLVLSLPAGLLPFVSLEQFGQIRTTHLVVGFQGLWGHGFPSLAAWVLFCGIIAPGALLALLVAILVTDGRKSWRRWNRELRRLAAFIEYWAMPEVQVLGVMIAFLKLGSIVNVHIGPGLGCYAGAAVCMLAAWRRFHLDLRANRVESSAREVTA